MNVPSSLTNRQSEQEPLFGDRDPQHQKAIALCRSILLRLYPELPHQYVTVASSPPNPRDDRG